MMDVTKYKPGRRLDAMVAMALGWRWAFPRGRTLYPPDDSVELASVDSPLVEDYWDVYVGEYNWSTNPGTAFEAALGAGVFEKGYKFGDNFGHWGSIYHVVTDNQLRKPRCISINAEHFDRQKSAYVLCLAILAIQPEETLAEFESWLEGVE